MVGFGFSVGDFIATIKAAAKIIDLLSAGSNSGSDFRQIHHQLRVLELALIQVKDLEVDERLRLGKLALEQGVSQCQSAISGFLNEVESHQPYLLQDNAPRKTKGQWMKAKWAFCKKNELEKIKLDLLVHTEAIHLLLEAVKKRDTDIKHQSHSSQQQSIMSHVQEGFLSCMSKLTCMSNTLFGLSSQVQDCLNTVRHGIRVSICVFQAFLTLQRLILLTIPGQIDCQKPVFLNDAAGRFAPFHLEFIRSKKALLSVLCDNFATFGRATRRIRDGDFSLHDKYTKKDINLDRRWEECFTPG